MEDRLNVRGARNLSPLYLAMIVALLGAGVAGAADMAPTAPNQNGVMTFPNVRVETAPPHATRMPAAAQTGMRAYIDPATGALRPASPDELMLESLQGQFAAYMLQQSPPLTEFVTQSGAIGIRLDESQMVFSVVQKSHDGALNEFCVVGPEQATKLLYLKAPANKGVAMQGGSR
jgi:hypothetical protein